METAAPTESWFDLSMSQHWSSISFIWRLVGALSTSTANRLLNSSNLHFWASKSANRQVNSELRFSTNCTWKHVGRELLFNVLAARKMVQVSLQHLTLPQAQLGLARVNKRQVLIDAPTHKQSILGFACISGTCARYWRASSNGHLKLSRGPNIITPWARFGLQA